MSLVDVVHGYSSQHLECLLRTAWTCEVVQASGVQNIKHSVPKVMGK